MTISERPPPTPALPPATGRGRDPESRPALPPSTPVARAARPSEPLPLRPGLEAASRPTLARRDAPSPRPGEPLSPERLAARANRPIPPVLSDDPREPEIYRQIYSGLELPSQGRVVVIGVTSAIRGEGRSSVAFGLASTLAADAETRVTLVEADFEHPSLAEALRAPASAGLASVLRGEQPISAVCCAVPTLAQNLWCIPAGRIGQDGARLLRGLGTTDPFRGPTGLTGIVIVDLPPIVNTSYGASAARLADATVLVIRAGVTPHRLVREAIARMEGRPPQGVVLTAFRSAIPRRWQGWYR